MSDDLNKIIGARLKFYRLANQMSQSKLGRQAGVTFQQIQKYENGSNKISVARLVDFSRILNFSMGEFFEAIVETTDNKPEIPREFIDYLSMPQAVELNRHFAGIDSQDLRRQIIHLLRAIRTLREDAA